jgi:hypothetical protein
VKGALLTITEKLVLDSEPQVARGGTTFPNHLMELRGDRVADPVEDDAVHPAPARIGGRSDVRVDVVEDHHHQVTPAGVGGGAGVEDDVHEGTDVEDSRCLEVKTDDNGLLIGGRGRRRVGGAKRRAATAAFSKANVVCSSRRVRAAWARQRAATAFSSASSASFTRASSLALRAAAATFPGSVPMLAQRLKA